MLFWGASPRLYLSYGIASLQGKRPSLSDAVAAVPPFSPLSPPLGLDYFAVFDGYRGTAVAKYLQERLCEAIAQGIRDELITWNPRCLRSESDNNAAEWWKVTMEVAFLSVDTRLVSGNAVGEDDVINVGATALVALVHENYIVLANCGFSKAVMSRGGEAVLLTPEHEAKLLLAPTVVVGGISVQSPMPVSSPNGF
jgi:protein phosphatase 2C